MQLNRLRSCAMTWELGGWDSSAGTRLWIQPGERIVWRGQPDAAVVFGPEDLLLVPFSLMWGGFAIFWEIGVTTQGWGVGSVWGIPFVLIGLYFIVGRFIYKRHNRRTTRYAITDRRIIVARKAGRNVQSEPLTQPNRVNRRRDGRHATLIWSPTEGTSTRRGPFGSAGSPFFMGAADSGWPMGSQLNQGGLGFFDVVDADTALRAIGSTA